MLIRPFFKKNIKFIFTILLLLFAMMTLYRIAFFYHFKPSGKALSGSMLWLGIRYDARIIAIAGIILLIAAALLKPFTVGGFKKTFKSIVTLIFVVIMLFYIADYYYFDYLKQRLSAAITSFAADAGISTSMIWQTYPVVRIIVACIALIFICNWVYSKIFLQINNSNAIISKRANVFAHVLFYVICAGLIFGRVGQYPLRWSDAFSLSDDFKANTALNPFQSFFSSLSFKNVGYDAKKVKLYYPTIAQYFNIPSTNDTAVYDRKIENNNPIGNNVNVVIVICESFSAYKSSMYGNGLNPTPYFNTLCNNGVFFNRCFTPAFGTARGVWATITGVPDVQDVKTASRNPAAVNQHSLMNDFAGYEKNYFLGGSTTWANIRGLLTNNITGLHIYEEDYFNAKKVDVWGISDKNLFLEANKILATQTKPFISIIQTADNHRPYTIPAEDANTFKKQTYPADTLTKYGFDSNEQLNAFRYTDFCFATFMEAAKKEKYFANTLFVFVGDHGLRGNAGNLFPQSFSKQGILAEHVPLLFYAPALLPAATISEPASQLDILPSVTYLIGQTATNTALGNNLFDTTNKKARYAFIADPDTRTIGVVSNSFFYCRNLNTNAIDFVSVLHNNPIPVNNNTDSIKKEMATATEAFYNTSKYLLLHNKKK